MFGHATDWAVWERAGAFGFGRRARACALASLLVLTATGAASAQGVDRLQQSIRDGGTVGVWIARGTTCDRSGLPDTGGLFHVRRATHRGGPALTTYSDDIVDGQAFGIESEACTLHGLRPVGLAGLFEGRFECSSEGMDRRSGTARVQIGRNPGERAPFLAIRMNGELERYTRCR